MIEDMYKIRISGWIWEHYRMVKTADPYRVDKERASAGVGLVVHIMFFILVNSLLCYICFSSGSDNYWVAFPLVGWGMGLYLHARSTYYFSFYKEA